LTTEPSKYKGILGRRADLGFTAILSIIFCLFYQLSSELVERNSTRAGHMLGSECDLKMHVQNLRYIPTPKNRAPRTKCFRRHRN